MTSFLAPAKHLKQLKNERAQMKTTCTILLMTIALFLSGCSPQEVVESEIRDKAKDLIKKTLKDKLSSEKLNEIIKSTLTTKKKRDQSETILPALEKFNQGKHKECLDQLKPLAARGNSKALYVSSLCLKIATHFQDRSQALRHLQAALPGLEALEKESNDVDATYYLGCHDMENQKSESGQARLRKVFPVFLAEAATGNTVYQLRVATMYFNGWGVKQDRIKALKHLSKCADKGYVHADYLIGHYYLKGDHVVQSLSKAKVHLQRAADKGYALAQTELGWQLYHSKSADDRQRGLKLMVMASIQNEPIAATLLDKISNTHTRPKATTGRTSKTTFKIPKTQAEVKSFIRKASRAVGNSIMESIGGGQDLVVSVKGVDYDSIMGQYDIDIVVSFNGVIFRSDNYLVAGRITVNEDGTNAKFAKTLCNNNFKEWEGILAGLAFAEIIVEAIEK